MSDDDLIFTILGVYGAIAVLAAIVAAIKGRSSFGWAIATLIFPPLVLVLFVLPSVRGETRIPAGKPQMPTWTQTARTAEASDQAAALQEALARAGARMESDVGKRIIGALASRAAQHAATTGADPRRTSPRLMQQSRSARLPAKPKPTPPEVPASVPATRDARPPKMDSLDPKAWKPKTSTVQRDARATVIYRRR